MVVQLQVVHNHQNGRDTHIRLVDAGVPFFASMKRLGF